jgi:hypothetical protein
VGRARRAAGRAVLAAGFLLNLPLCAAVVLVALRHVPESRDADASPHLDVAGAVLGALGLAGVTYALIGLGGDVSSAVVLATGLGGLALLAAFLAVEARSRAPMLPLGVFGSRQFSAANAVTFAVYAALAGVFFLLVVHLQVVSGYSPLAAGVALVPVTLLMLTLSSRSGCAGGADRAPASDVGRPAAGGRGDRAAGGDRAGRPIRHRGGCPGRWCSASGW